MRCSTQIVLYITLLAAAGAPALAQRGYGGVSRGITPAAPPSSTAIGAGASVGRAAFPSSTAIGAGAPTRGQLVPYRNGASGFNNAGGRSGVNSRSPYTRNGRRGDYRNVPLAYALAPYYYPFLDYGSAPYGDEPQEYDPNADPALVTVNLLGEQLQRVTAELRQLKANQQQPAAPSDLGNYTPEPPAPVIPVTVVLRDGQKLQVQNYAVMDQTFWDFSRQPARRIPLSSIDVSASTQATAANGGEFPQFTSRP